MQNVARASSQISHAAVSFSVIRTDDYTAKLSPPSSGLDCGLSVCRAALCRHDRLEDLARPRSLT